MQVHLDSRASTLQRVGWQRSERVYIGPARVNGVYERLVQASQFRGRALDRQARAKDTRLLVFIPIPRIISCLDLGASLHSSPRVQFTLLPLIHDC